jgi:hypothetical protein
MEVGQSPNWGCSAKEKKDQLFFLVSEFFLQMFSRTRCKEDCSIEREHLHETTQTQKIYRHSPCPEWEPNLRVVTVRPL